MARVISEISRKTVPLLYYLPEEIEKATQEDRLLLIKENEKIVAFAFWYFYDNWVELATLYVAPEFRGRGYLRQMVNKIAEGLKDKNVKPFLFTQVPQVAHVAESFGLKQTPYSTLPLQIFLRILLHRLHPRRWLSYLKHLKNIPRIFKTRLYLRDS